MLKNIFYTGDFMVKDRFYKGKHEPLVSLNLFQQVQEVFQAANKPKMTKRTITFAGLLTCEECGHAITGDIKKGKYVYYRCNQCKSSYTKEETIAEQFEEAIQQLEIKEEQLQWIVPILKSSHQEEINFHEQRIRQLEERHERLRRRIELIYEDKLDGKIPEELWFRKNEEYKQEMVSIETNLHQHSKSNFDYVECGIRVLELAQKAYRLYKQQSVLEQHRMLDFIFSNCTLNSGKVEYTYKIPFDLIAEGIGNEKNSG